MENIILISKCFEKAKIGYVSTHIEMNRSTNEILSVSYNWNEHISTKNSKTFNSFESLNAFINELIDLKNECELNSLEIKLMKDNVVYWKMHNGDLISVDNMDINHLRNTLKMIIRNREKALQQLQSKRKVEFKLNGDIAEFFNEEQNNSFQNDYYESALEVGMTDIETGIL